MGGLAALLHADEDRRVIFDTLWMAGLFVSVVAVLPQLWLITKSGGRVEALTSHYVAALALSRVMASKEFLHVGDVGLHTLQHELLPGKIGVKTFSADCANREHLAATFGPLDRVADEASA